jgi:hypothetical protein
MATITEVRGPADWRGAELTDDRWRYELTSAHRAEVREAVEVPGFPLPTLGPELRRLAGDVVDGRGFVLIRGIPIEQADAVALGIARYLGRIVPQPGGLPLLHVRDTGADPTRATTRSYQHRHRLGYHADPTDMVGLLCLRPARSGGQSAIVSAVAVHNEIVRTRPDLAHILYRPWWFDRRTGDGPDSFYQQPVYATGPDGGLVYRYGPDYLRSAQRGAHVPPLTAEQLDAMAVLDELTNDPRYALVMDLRPGDLQVLNNRVILHARTEFEDDPDPARRRDLIRLWLDFA